MLLLERRIAAAALFSGEDLCSDLLPLQVRNPTEKDSGLLLWRRSPYKSGPLIVFDLSAASILVCNPEPDRFGNDQIFLRGKHFLREYSYIGNGFLL
ncbi:hypothetical protein MRB53_015967 [Persea americana]|uniref:Uncharacterized protein n=1 Tax=Persea americana TaxID=3435 RepID=A0ACC2M1F7_PERAE|nr:hypothetical protein MRB53_015967 [Persea americana]